MRFVWARAFVVFLVVSVGAGLKAQQIQSTYADLSLPGNWQPAKQFASAQFGSDVFYDASTGAVLRISQQAGMQKVEDIAKFFGGTHGPSREAAAGMSSAEFPLPMAFTERASKDLAKSNKPPKLWELKDGEGNPLWFYASQLFDDYRMRDTGGSSEVTEEYLSVRVNEAEQRPVTGGDVLVFEVETEKPAGEPALRRFRMPAGFKDQKIRYGWVQFAPGGIASGQGVLSVAYAVAANSTLTVDEVAKQVSMAKIKSQ
ncbi:MAG: hypothetical protein WBS19_02730 [Candidatus Korobacteraceae bacterium]